MRKHISIVGVGERMQGIGKNSQKPYDFTPISFTYDDPYITGTKAAHCNVNADAMGDYRPMIGDTVEVVMREDYKSGRVYIDAVL